MTARQWMAMIVLVIICSFIGCIISDIVVMEIAKQWIHDEIKSNFSNLSFLFKSR